MTALVHEIGHLPFADTFSGAGGFKKVLKIILHLRVQLDIEICPSFLRNFYGEWIDTRLGQVLKNFYEKFFK